MSTNLTVCGFMENTKNKISWEGNTIFFFSTKFDQLHLMGYIMANNSFL